MAELSHTSLGLAGVIGKLIGLINHTIPVLVALALVFFMWTCFQYVRAAAQGGETSQYRNNILWSIISLFVIISVWGLLRILCGTFLPGSC